MPKAESVCCLIRFPALARSSPRRSQPACPIQACSNPGATSRRGLGLTPRQQSSGGKEKLGAITKQGNQYLRKMLVVGCTSALRVAARRKGVLADWIAALRARKPERLVAVALANKLARICGAIMTTGEVFARRSSPRLEDKSHPGGVSSIQNLASANQT